MNLSRDIETNSKKVEAIKNYESEAFSWCDMLHAFRFASRDVVVFTAEVSGTDEIKHWAMSWGQKTEVLAPDFLRDEIARELQACLKRYAPEVSRAEEI
jgi:predicted DNA-binding transcriptional regulator YafY